MPNRQKKIKEHLSKKLNINHRAKKSSSSGRNKTSAEPEKDFNDLDTDGINRLPKFKVSTKAGNVSYENTKTILIAEDEPVNYLYLEAALFSFQNELKTKFYILHAEDGEDAVEIAKNSKAIDLILMDIRMPKMNGNDSAEIIKKYNSKTPIIAQTAFKDEIFNEELFIRTLRKPIDLNDLRSIVKQFLGH
jgi:CheY-like chemotaxis protein